MQSEQGQLLVVERDQATREALVTKLEQLGYSILATDDGKQALDYLKRKQAALLILSTDVAGLPYTRILEKNTVQPGEPPVPVLMLVSLADLPEVSRGSDHEIFDYLYDPMPPEILRKRIEDALEHRELYVEEQSAERKMKELSQELTNVVLSIGMALASEKDLDKLLERIVVEAQVLCNADAGTLYLRTDDDHLKFAIVRTSSLRIAMGGTTSIDIPFPPLPLYDPATKQPNYHNVASSVALTGEPISVADVYTAENFDFSATKSFDQHNNYRTVSTIAIPLKRGDSEVIGVLQLINALDFETDEPIPFDPQQLLMVELLAAQTTVALNHRALLHRQAELLKFERDLEIGKQIQTNFLPSRLPEAEGWEVAACFRPAREVAGDFYDAFEIAANHIWFNVADVCDKGVGAALFMALARSLLRAYAQQTRDLALLHHPVPAGAVSDPEQSRTFNTGATTLRNTVKLTNDYMINNHGDLNMFATFFGGVIDTTMGSLVFINGGHNPPILLDAENNIKERYLPTGPAVGMMPDADFQIGKAIVKPGDTLFCFTDGVTDARNPNGKLFTEKRMIAELQSVKGLTAKELLDHMFGKLLDHIDTASQFDDITMLAVRRQPLP